MKDRILMVGIGACGGNIANEFEKIGYHALYINTSSDDLDALDGKHKYHIVGANGCHKDRKLAYEYTKEYFNQIKDNIHEKFRSQDIVYLIFSLGGGTGSGISPIMLEILTNQYPQKTFGAICVIPDMEESLKAKINAVECYKQLSNISKLKNRFILDNSNMQEKFEINKKFVTLFDRLINITNISNKGIIDKAELEHLLKTKGSVYLAEFEDRFKDNSIFTRYLKGCKYLALSLKDEIDIREIELELGKPIDVFKGYTERSNFVASFGMKMPKERILELIEMIELESEEIEEDTEEFEFDVPTIPREEGKENEKETGIDDIFKKFKM